VLSLGRANSATIPARLATAAATVRIRIAEWPSSSGDYGDCAQTCPVRTTRFPSNLGDPCVRPAMIA